MTVIDEVPRANCRSSEAAVACGIEFANNGGPRARNNTRRKPDSISETMGVYVVICGENCAITAVAFQHNVPFGDMLIKERGDGKLWGAPAPNCFVHDYATMPLHQQGFKLKGDRNLKIN